MMLVTNEICLSGQELGHSQQFINRGMSSGNKYVLSRNHPVIYAGLDISGSSVTQDRQKFGLG
jgi:hypothetical protein